MQRAAVLILALCLAASGCRKATDEASVRQREAGELRARLGVTKVTLYRAVKTAVRSLPPRDAVYRLVAGKAELTRDEWSALMEKEPALSVYRQRVGLFVVGAHLREAAYAGALIGAAILAAKGGGRLVGDPSDLPVLQLPRTTNPFGSPVGFYRECKDVLADDEDRYPTLCASMLPGPLFEAARDRRDVFARPPFDRIALPAFEHLVLGCAWLGVQPDLALYELHRARLEDLRPIEAGIVRAARAVVFLKQKWHYHALDELAALEKELPEIGRSAAELDKSLDPKEAEAVLAGVVHLMRYEIYLALKRNDEAAKELEQAQVRLAGQERLKSGAHLIAAKVLLDQGKYKEAAVQVRLAADSLPGDAKMQAELRALAAEIERELPESNAPLDVLAFAVRLLLREAYRLAVSEEVVRWSEGFRDKAGEQIEAWEKSFPSTGELSEKGKELWRRLGPG